MDEEFFKQCSDKSFNIVNFESTIEDKSQREIYLEKIKDLQEELLFQISKENYEIADTLKKTIDELKRRLNEEL